MREIGTPTYTEEELVFARKIGEQIPPREKRTMDSGCPGWEGLMDVDLNTSISDPYGEGVVRGGSTDSADVSWQTPIAKLTTASLVLGAPIHSWMIAAVVGMSIGHKNLIVASKVLACTTLDLITRPEILKKSWEEFKKRKGGREYKSPLPPDLKPSI